MKHTYQHLLRSLAPLGAALGFILVMSACWTDEQDFSPALIPPAVSMSTLPPMEVGPTSDAGTTITSTVGSIFLSARVLLLDKPTDGFSSIALNEDCIIITPDGREVPLTAIETGMRLKVSGTPGKSGALLADEVLLFETRTGPG